MDTFGDFADEWLTGQKLRLRPSTWAGYESSTRLYLLPALGALPLTGITSATLNRLYAQLRHGGGVRFGDLSASSVHHVHVVGSRLFDSALLQGLLTVNPAWGASPPRADGGDVRPAFRVWTAAQLREFLRLTERHPMAALFHVAATTGMRRSELLGLTWDDVTDGTVLVSAALTCTNGRISRHRPKNRRPRRVTLDAGTRLRLERHRLWEALKPRPRPRKWNLVFTDDDGGFLHPDHVTHAFRTFVARNPLLPRIRFHDLRHTNATLLLTSGVPMHVVAARLGHSPRVLLTHYAHMLPSADTGAATLFGALMDGESVTYRVPVDDTLWAEAGTGFDNEMWQWNKRSPAKRLAARNVSSLATPRHGTTRLPLGDQFTSSRA